LADSPKPVIEVGNCLGRVRINKKLQAKWQVVVPERESGLVFSNQAKIVARCAWSSAERRPVDNTRAVGLKGSPDDRLLGVECRNGRLGHGGQNVQASPRIALDHLSLDFHRRGDRKSVGIIRWQRFGDAKNADVPPWFRGGTNV